MQGRTSESNRALEQVDQRSCEVSEDTQDPSEHFAAQPTIGTLL